jgi:CRP-like cAMP-binding protein
MSQPPSFSIDGGSERTRVRNLLLGQMSGRDFAILQPFLEEVEVERGDIIGRPDEPPEHIYFPENLIVSVLVAMRDGHQIEVGMIGREGMTGISNLLGVDRSPYEALIQVPGRTLRIRTDNLSQVITTSQTLHSLLLKYVQVCNVQAACTALSHGGYTISARLARWLLMCHDRLEGKDIPLVHEILAIMLGVRRPGVTEHLHLLESVHAIKATRGLIRIIDRPKLLKAAGDSYGLPESEYERLIGAFRRA